MGHAMANAWLIGALACMHAASGALEPATLATRPTDATIGTLGTVTQPVHRCRQDVLPGPCKGSFPRYFYNMDTRECEVFIYGGEPLLLCSDLPFCRVAVIVGLFRHNHASCGMQHGLWPHHAAGSGSRILDRQA